MRGDGIRTGVKRGWDGVEHVRVHIRVHHPVGGGVVPCGDEDGIALGDCDAEQVDWGFLDVGLIHLSGQHTFTTGDKK